MQSELTKLFRKRRVVVVAILDNGTDAFTKDCVTLHLSEKRQLLVKEAFIAHMHLRNPWIIEIVVPVADQVLPSTTELAVNL